MLHSTLLAALLPPDILDQVLTVAGYPAVTLFIMIESMGIPFPGETMLLLASFYASTTHHLQLPLIIFWATLGAVLGDNLGYLIGRTGGRSFVQRFGHYFFVKPHHLAHAERFFEKHGGKTVFLGRFTAILRTWSAFLAGVHHMPWRVFLFYNASGGILWAILYGLLGFYAGHFFHNNFARVEQLANTLGWATAGLIVIVVIALVLLVRWRSQRCLRQSATTSDNQEKLQSSWPDEKDQEDQDNVLPAVIEETQSQYSGESRDSC